MNKKVELKSTKSHETTRKEFIFSALFRVVSCVLVDSQTFVELTLL